MIELVVGDIVDQDVDAIVNAANTSLLGGGGVDGAIHDAAGPELLAECRTLGGCATGDAKITRGYALRARWVVHAVGPRYGGRTEDAELLASAHRASLALCDAHGLASVAFPAISTGVYRYPPRLAAPIALRTVAAHLAGPTSLRLVRFVLYDDAMHAVFDAALRAIEAPR